MVAADGAAAAAAAEIGAGGFSLRNEFRAEGSGKFEEFALVTPEPLPNGPVG